MSNVWAANSPKYTSLEGATGAPQDADSTHCTKTASPVAWQSPAPELVIVVDDQCPQWLALTMAVVGDLPCFLSMTLGSLHARHGGGVRSLYHCGFEAHLAMGQYRPTKKGLGEHNKYQLGHLGDVHWG